MSLIATVTPLHESGSELRRARAAFIKALLDEDDRSVRYVAGKIGISNTALGDRLKGKVAFLADELEPIARILKIDPVQFYAAYLAAGTKNGPASEETGPQMLPHLDSNQEPIG